MKTRLLLLMLLCAPSFCGASSYTLGRAPVATLVATATPIPAVATATPIPAPTLVATATAIPTPTSQSIQMAELFITSSVETTIATQSVWVKVAGTTVLRMSQLSDDDGGTSNRLRYTGTDRIMTHSGATLSFLSASNNQVIKITMSKHFDLTTDALTTVGIGLSTIDITWAGHDVDTQDTIVLSGAATFDGITDAELNVNHAVTSIPDANTIRITVASDTATAGSVSGGGASIVGNIILASAETEGFVGTGADMETTAVHGMAHLNQNEALEIWICNDTSTGNITVSRMNLFSLGLRN